MLEVKNNISSSIINKFLKIYKIDNFKLSNHMDDSIKFILHDFGQILFNLNLIFIGSGH